LKIFPSAINPSGDVTDFLAEQNGKTSFNSLTLSTSFSHDTRNRTVFATTGTQQTVGMNMTVPGSDLEFYKVDLKRSP